MRSPLSKKMVENRGNRAIPATGPLPSVSEVMCDGGEARSEKFVGIYFGDWTSGKTLLVIRSELSSTTNSVMFSFQAKLGIAWIKPLLSVRGPSRSLFRRERSWQRAKQPSSAANLL